MLLGIRDAECNIVCPQVYLAYGGHYLNFRRFLSGKFTYL